MKKAIKTKKAVKTKKKIVAKKKATLKPKSKKSTVRNKKGKKDLNLEIIFDSRVGNTDALFVDEPQNTPTAQLPTETPVENPELKIPEMFPDSILDPELNNSLKEFDAIQNPKPEIQPQTTQEQKIVQKKKWWQRLFKI